ncbi:MAG: type II toxin-antitoxin system Phd/YefM family antitoxin [Candidatus Binatia bacterium]
MTQGISVVEAKKRFSELLARAAYSRERFVIERRGKPMAALIGLKDLNLLEEKKAQEQEPQGLLAAAQALADYEGFEEIMAEVYRSRWQSDSRKVKLD